MEHFVAYHNAQGMGRELEQTGELGFLSRKLGVLKKAVGNTVWVVQGIRNGRKTEYLLCGAYIADHVDVEDPSSNLYRISGEAVKEFSPPVQLNGLDWFPALQKSQSNFSLGFNRINNDVVLRALDSLAASPVPALPSALPDLDLAFTGSEGSVRLVEHLRRERNRKIVEAKKAATLAATGRLRCEACGFDFLEVYGPLGENYCEVHHVVPLSTAPGSVVTRLDDLAILCSNCHRMVHRPDPMLSISKLAALIRE